MRTSSAFHFACPLCQTPLEACTAEVLRCPADAAQFRCEDGIWRFLPAHRATSFQQFLHEYRQVRRAEGWGSSDPAYYLALPFADLSGRFPALWRLRAASFRALIDQVLRPREDRQGTALKILDLGTGNGWLAHRLAERGHLVAAVDLSDDPLDGLGAHRWYRANAPAAAAPPFLSVQAEVDRLPFVSGQADLAIFNASFHYSTHYATTLAEALRVLRPDGAVVILDSPLYRQAASGAAMVREREERFEQSFGFRSNALPHEHYLTYDQLDRLGRDLGLTWRLIMPGPGWRWAARAVRARLRRSREPARMPLIIGERARAIPPEMAPSPLARSLARFFRLWRFRLLQRHRHNRLVLEQVAGRPLVVLPGVFNPGLFLSSEVLVECLDAGAIAPGSSVLELGTGTGLAAIVAARWARQVAAVDINPAAVRCARINALLNGVDDRVAVYQGDLFAPVQGQRFDIVLFNPPYLPGTPRDELDRAFRSPGVIERFAARLRDHLTPAGYGLVVLSSEAEVTRYLQVFQAHGLATAVAWERRLLGETFRVYRLCIDSQSPQQ